MPINPREQQFSDPGGIKDDSGMQINPATEETLQSIAGGIGISSSIVAGIKNIIASGTPETIVASSTTTKSITICALDTNTGNIWVGDSNVSSASKIGIPLLPSNSITLSIDDSVKVYLDCDVSGEGVSYIILN